MEQRERIIKNYIEAYNNYDIDNMLADFDDNIKFENIADGQVDMAITGIDNFREQAEQAKAIFNERKQTIRSMEHDGDRTTVEIGYSAVLAVDFPNDLKKGDVLNLVGRSIFSFRGD